MKALSEPLQPLNGLTTDFFCPFPTPVVWTNGPDPCGHFRPLLGGSRGLKSGKNQLNPANLGLFGGTFGASPGSEWVDH